MNLLVIAETILKSRPLVVFNDGDRWGTDHYYCSWCGGQFPSSEALVHKPDCQGVALTEAIGMASAMVEPGLVNVNDLLHDLRIIRYDSDRTGRIPDEKTCDELVTKFGQLDDVLSDRGRLPVAWARKVASTKWTEADGIQNSSPKFSELVRDVNATICNHAQALIAGQSKDVAAMIVDRLVHVFGLAPTEQS